MCVALRYSCVWRWFGRFVMRETETVELGKMKQSKWKFPQLAHEIEAPAATIGKLTLVTVVTCKSFVLCQVLTSPCVCVCLMNASFFYSRFNSRWMCMRVCVCAYDSFDWIQSQLIKWRRHSIAPNHFDKSVHLKETLHSSHAFCASSIVLDVSDHQRGSRHFYIPSNFKRRWK